MKLKSIGHLTWLILGRANHARKNPSLKFARTQAGEVEGSKTKPTLDPNRIQSEIDCPKPLGADHREHALVISFKRPKPLLTKRSASGLLRSWGEEPAGVHAVRKGSAAQE